MTVDTSLIAGRPSKWDGILDVFQMLTGVGLILFMWMHMTLVASVLIGPGVMNAIAGFFEDTGMAQVGGPLIFLLFFVHFLLAVRKVPSGYMGLKTAFSHARMVRHADTTLWLVQVVSALIILLMGSIHMWVVLTDLPITAAKSAARIQSGWWGVFYLILLPMVELHVGVGLYRVAMKWGFVKSGGRKKFHRAENILTLVFVCIGVATIIRLWLLNAS